MGRFCNQIYVLKIFCIYQPRHYLMPGFLIDNVKCTLALLKLIGLKNNITRFIDWFYPPFRRVMPLQTFRYAVCGGSNMVLDILIYYISYNFILHKQILNIGFYAFKPHMAALFMAFCVSFPTGFLLSKYVVFNTSFLRGRIQLFRYMLVVAINLFLNYSFLKILVEYMQFYPTIARIFATAFIVTFSYVSQKHFSFRTIKSNSGQIKSRA